MYVCGVCMYVKMYDIKSSSIIRVQKFDIDDMHFMNFMEVIFYEMIAFEIITRLWYFAIFCRCYITSYILIFWSCYLISPVAGCWRDPSDSGTPSESPDLLAWTVIGRRVLDGQAHSLSRRCPPNKPTARSD